MFRLRRVSRWCAAWAAGWHLVTLLTLVPCLCAETAVASPGPSASCCCEKPVAPPCCASTDTTEDGACHETQETIPRPGDVPEAQVHACACDGLAGLEPTALPVTETAGEDPPVFAELERPPCSAGWPPVASPSGALRGTAEVPAHLVLVTTTVLRN